MRGVFFSKALRKLNVLFSVVFKTQCFVIRWRQEQVFAYLFHYGFTAFFTLFVLIFRFPNASWPACGTKIQFVVSHACSLCVDPPKKPETCDKHVLLAPTKNKTLEAPTVASPNASFKHVVVPKLSLSCHVSFLFSCLARQTRSIGTAEQNMETKEKRGTT